MPTIKDIAHKAGVSHGTVSNVLNNRGNVSVEKMNLVKKAVEELGYKVNVQAKNLRQGKTNQVAIIIPRVDIKRYIDLYIGINTVLSKKGFDVTIHCSNDSFDQEIKFLNTISASNPTAIVLISTSQKNKFYENNNIPLYFVLQQVKFPPKNSVYIGFDYYKIGYELTLKSIDEGNTNISCFCGLQSYYSDFLFYKGYCDAIERYDFKKKGFFSENSTSFHRAFKIINDLKSYDSCIVLGQERVESLISALKIKHNVEVLSIYSATSKSFNEKNQNCYYELNYKYCGTLVANKIINEDKNDLIIKVNSINNHKNNIVVKDNFKQINFLALESPTSDALSLLVPKFEEKTGIKVKIIKYPYQELYNKAQKAQNTKAYDIIRIDMAWLSTFGEKLFTPLDLDSSPYKDICDSFMPGIPNNYFYSYGQSFSLPFDTSIQLLYYRRDLFENALVKREFYENTKRQLEVPQTYEDFDFIAKYFTKAFNPNSPTKYGTSMIKGSSVAIACELLPRIKAAGESVVSKDGKIVVNTPKIKEIVKEYLTLSNCTSKGQYSWWEDSIEEFANEEIAMTIVFGNHASRLVQSQNTEIINKIGFAPIPGGAPMLGGGVLGVSKNSEKKEEIDLFLKWVYSRETTDFVNYLGGYINSKNNIENIDAINLYPWTIGIETSLKNGWRIPQGVKSSFDEFEFEQTFGSVLSSIASGLLDVDEGLSEAQRAIDLQFNQ
ncbi:MAG: extracellular solute-binding protein [Pleomorphochaeta sp.]